MQKQKSISLTELRSQLLTNKPGNRVIVVDQKDEKLNDAQLFLKYANR